MPEQYSNDRPRSQRLSRREALGLIGGVGAAALLFPYSGGRASAAGGLPVVVRLGQPRPVGAHDLPVLGFNAQNSMNPFGYAEPNGVRTTKRLSPGPLRFPGGTVGNWYDWRNDRYFDLPPELAQRHTGPAQWQKNLDTTRGGKVGFDAFMSLVRQTGAEPVLMVNLYHPIDFTPDQLAGQAAGWVRHVNVKRGLGVKYWELGNEYYVKAYVDRYADPDGPRGRDPEEYVETARKAAEAMKAVDPSIELIAVAASPDVSAPTTAGSSGGSSEGTAWNEPLVAADFYDVVAMHPYVITTDSIYADVPPGEPGIGTGDYKAEARWLFSVTQNQPRLIHDYVLSSFGAEGAVWYTEWAVLSSKAGGTVLGALHDADSVLHTADYPETVQALLNQNLTAPSGLYVYSYCQDAAGRWTTRTVKSASYYVFEQLDEVINGADAVVPVQLGNVPTFPGRFQYANAEIEGVTVRAWEMPDGGTKVAAVNKLDRPQRLRFEGHGTAPNGGVTQLVLTGPLAAENSCNAPNTIVPTVRKIEQPGSPRVDLPAYSFSLITIKP